MSFFSREFEEMIARRTKTGRSKSRGGPTYDAKDVDDYIIGLTERIRIIRQDLRRALD